MWSALEALQAEQAYDVTIFIVLLITPLADTWSISRWDLSSATFYVFFVNFFLLIYLSDSLIPSADMPQGQRPCVISEGFFSNMVRGEPKWG